VDRDSIYEDGLWYDSLSGGKWTGHRLLD